MILARLRSTAAPGWGPLGLTVLLLGLSAGLAPAAETATELPSVFNKALPESVQELKDIQAHVKTVVDKVIPCTVGLRIGQAQGSGVIINKDGYILTAGHVSGQPGRPVVITLHDGRTLKGITLGANTGIDSGMVKITDEGGEFPSVEMAKSADVKKGQWVIAVGHPGGFQKGRAPVVRVGRILDMTSKFLRTDCTLVGGDSGGPLFDMHGHVIAIHSRIGGAITFNIHVPVDTYRETWDKLAASEVWGNNAFSLGLGKQQSNGEAYMGIRANPDLKICKIQTVSPDSPAEKAGLRVDDVILKIDDRDIGTLDDLTNLLRGKRPGNQVNVLIRRGQDSMVLSVTLGRRPG